MVKQLLGFNIRDLRSHSLILNIVFPLGLTMFFACSEAENNRINLQADLSPYPSQEIYESTIIRTDSGRVMMKIESPLIQEYDIATSSPYTLLPKGGNILRYENIDEKPIFIKANWAKIDKQKQLYEGKEQVLMISKTNDSIKTSHIIWDQKKHKIYNQVKTTIIRPNGDYIIAHDGFIADDTFKNVKLFNNKAVKQEADFQQTQ